MLLRGSGATYCGSRTKFWFSRVRATAFLQHIELWNNAFEGEVPDFRNAPVSFLQLRGNRRLTAQGNYRTWLSGFAPLWNDGC